MKNIICLLLLWCLPLPGFTQKNAHDREMNKPFAPFRIAGNIYYVGASDVTAYLITSPQGHILIDGGFETTAAQIRSNIEKLGFRLKDVKILLINHAHYDHCGGLALLKKWTGARLYANPADIPVLEDGGKSDFHFGGSAPLFTPVKVDAPLRDGQEITLGDNTLKTWFTPGHTKGATTWTMVVQEQGRSCRVVFASSITALDYKLIGNAAYPGIAADFTHTFNTLESIKPDVFLGAHGQFFDLEGKAARLRRRAGTNPFIDPEGYRAFVAEKKKDFSDKLAAARKAGH